jgi:hypothetical protein
VIGHTRYGSCTEKPQDRGKARGLLGSLAFSDAPSDRHRRVEGRADATREIGGAVAFRSGRTDDALTVLPRPGLVSGRDARVSEGRADIRGDTEKPFERAGRLRGGRVGRSLSFERDGRIRLARTGRGDRTSARRWGRGGDRTCRKRSRLLLRPIGPFKKKSV